LDKRMPYPAGGFCPFYLVFKRISSSFLWGHVLNNQIIVIKLGLGIDPVKRPGLRFYRSTQINPEIHSFFFLFEGCWQQLQHKSNILTAL
jgi:hypothetical protein